MKIETTKISTISNVKVSSLFLLLSKKEQQGTMKNNKNNKDFNITQIYIIEATASSLCNNQQQQTNNSKNQQQNGTKLSEWFWNEETDHFDFLIKVFAQMAI